MKIVNNNKTPKCKWCGKEIVERRKVKWKNKSFYHISCLYEYSIRKFKEWRQVKNHLSRYKRDMIIEKLR